MIRNRRIKGHIQKGLVFLLVLLCLTRTVSAASLIEPDRTGKLTITYSYDKVPFFLYKTADVSAECEYRWTEDFRGYSVSLGDNSEDAWKAAAGKLAAYIRRDEPEPFRRGTTDEQGGLVFDGLETGLYLVMGEAHRTDFVGYAFLPFLVPIPGLNENGEWEYELTAVPKRDSSLDPLPDGGMESTPSDNKKPGTESSGSSGSSGASEKLPQTGQLWWPVPLLAVCGMFLVAAGLWIQRKRK